MRDKDFLKQLGKVSINTDMMDIIPGGVVGVSALGKNLLFCSDGLFALLGYQREEFMSKICGNWYYILVHPEDQQWVKQEVFSQLQNDGKIAMEFRILKKSGETLWVNLYAGFVRDPKWGLYIQGIVFDNTPSHFHAADAQATRERMDTLMTTVPGGVAELILDQDLHVSIASEGYYRMTGYTKEEFEREPICNRSACLLLPEDREAVEAAIHLLIETNESTCVEYRIRRKDGTIAWNAAYCSGVVNQNGVFTTQGVFIDTTSAKNTEHRLNSLTNSIPGGVAQIKLEFTGELKVEYASKGFFTLTGYAVADFMEGRHHSDYRKLIVPEDQEVVFEKVRRVMEHSMEGCIIEHRIRHQDGTIHWVRMSCSRVNPSITDSVGLECIFTDITKSKHIQRLMALNEERYRIISEQCQDIILDWDMENHTLFLSLACQKKLGVNFPQQDVRKFISHSDFVHDKDKPRLCQLEEAIRNGRRHIEMEFRLKNYMTSEYIWYRMTATVIFDEEDQPVRMVGLLSDINEYIKENANWKEKARRDLLTGLLNKITLQETIEEILHKSTLEQKHVVFLIDIDNFKGINDQLGHAMGDIVLTEISSRILEAFPDADLVGRIGGDEFAVFMENVSSYEEVRQKADILCTIFRHTFHQRGKTYQISGSIGAAIYPEDGQSFKELYRHADDAMYYSKKHGKNCVSFRSGWTTTEESFACSCHQKEIECKEYQDIDFSALIFEVLYEAHSFTAAIDMVLELIAQYYKIASILIGELNPINNQLTKTFEYTLPEIPFVPNLLSWLQYSDLRREFESCQKEKGVFYCDDVSTLPDGLRTLFTKNHVETALVLPIMLNGEILGCISFLETRKDYLWTEEKMRIITYLAKIISTFLTRRNRTFAPDQSDSENDIGSVKAIC